MAYFKFWIASILAALSMLQVVVGEHHTVKFHNRCGFGTPLLKAGGRVLSRGEPFTSKGPLSAAIAFLQTGKCGENGEYCTLVETTLRNPTSRGSGSSSDISLIAPHRFSVKSGFGYYGGCDSTGADCTSGNCSTAFHRPEDTFVQVACQSSNVNLVIKFCD